MRLSWTRIEYLNPNPSSVFLLDLFVIHLCPLILSGVVVLQLGPKLFVDMVTR
jgi:hypothetical protein